MQIKLSDSPGIWVGNRLSEQIDQCLQDFSPSKIWILADTNTAKYCLNSLYADSPLLKNAGLIEIETGEHNKSLQTSRLIWETLAREGADRQSILINLGGGIVGDIGGFAASTFMRGIPFIQMPTTLLSMVDSAVGGKTGINFLGIKNLVGSFQHPAAVFVQTDFLKSLPDEEKRSGFAEMVKHALIEGGMHWEKIRAIRNPEIADLEELIADSVRLKLAITQKDFKESGLREVLNLGHTTAHALESLYLNEETQLLHGYAVAAGLAVETYIASSWNECLNKEAAQEIRNYLYSVFPPVCFYPHQFDTIIELMQHDKKNKSGKIRFSLLGNIGAPKHGCDVPVDLIRTALEKYMADVGYH